MPTAAKTKSAPNRKRARKSQTKSLPQKSNLEVLVEQFGPLVVQAFGRLDQNLELDIEMKKLDLEVKRFELQNMVPNPSAVSMRYAMDAVQKRLDAVSAEKGEAKVLTDQAAILEKASAQFSDSDIEGTSTSSVHLTPDDVLNIVEAMTKKLEKRLGAIERRVGKNSSNKEDA